MKNYLFFLFTFFSIPVSFSVSAYEIGDFNKAFEDDYTEAQRSGLIKKTFLDVFKEYDIGFDSVSIILYSQDKREYSSCCWHVDGVFDFLGLKCLNSNTPNQSLFIDIKERDLDNFWINIEEYNHWEIFKGTVTGQISKKEIKNLQNLKVQKNNSSLRKFVIS